MFDSYLVEYSALSELPRPARAHALLEEGDLAPYTAVKHTLHTTTGVMETMWNAERFMSTVSIPRGINAPWLGIPGRDRLGCHEERFLVS